MWMQNRDKVYEVKKSAGHLTRILEPIARACKCLESSRSTPADVYIFWLAVLATYADIIARNDEADGLQMPTDVLKGIRKIVNSRWSQMTDGPDGAVYLSAFFLDPCTFIPIH